MSWVSIAAFNLLVAGCAAWAIRSMMIKKLGWKDDDCSVEWVIICSWILNIISIFVK